MSLTEVLPLAMELADDERRELAEVLLGSVPSNDEIDHELIAELERRVDDATSGKVELINVKQSHAKLRAQLAAMSR